MKSPFQLVARQGLFGAIVGLFGGLILAIVIYAILMLSEVILGSGNMNGEFPAQFVLMLGMGWGTVLGAIFGAVTAMKK